MNISIDAEKVFDIPLNSFIIKTLSKLGLDGNFLHMIQNVYQKQNKTKQK